MALSDPVAIYNAANNVEAHLVRNALLASGVEAHVTEDVSQVGTWIGGLIPEIHKPQVWVERADIERARPILDDFERRSIELQSANAEGDAAVSQIETVCQKCGSRVSFPEVQRGSVQECPECGAYIDVGDADFLDGWEEGEAEAT